MSLKCSVLCLRFLCNPEKKRSIPRMVLACEGMMLIHWLCKSVTLVSDNSGVRIEAPWGIC